MGCKKLRMTDIKKGRLKITFQTRLAALPKPSFYPTTCSMDRIMFSSKPCTSYSHSTVNCSNQYCVSFYADKAFKIPSVCQRTKSNKQHGTDLLGDFNFQKNLFAATKEALMKLVIKIILILLTLSVCAFAVF